MICSEIVLFCGINDARIQSLVSNEAAEKKTRGVQTTTQYSMKIL